MSSGLSATESSVTNKSTVSDVDAVVESAESKLLKFDEEKKVSPGKDINTKITALDTDLAQLRSELSFINVSVEEGRFNNNAPFTRLVTIMLYMACSGFQAYKKIISPFSLPMLTTAVICMN